MTQPDPARLPVLNQVLEVPPPCGTAEPHAGQGAEAPEPHAGPATPPGAPWDEALRAALERRLDAELLWRVRALLAPRLDALADELAEALQPALRDIAHAALEEIRNRPAGE